jgi:hypothetical protein
MRSPRAALVLAAILVLAGCGGGPPARVWAARVCDALVPWRARIGELTTGTQQQMTARTTPAQAKENLVRLLGGAESASETARASLVEAGVPDVDRGDAIAGAFVATLTSVRDAYGRARRTIEGLETGPAFYDGVGAAVSTLDDEYKAGTLDTSTLDSLELRRAFDEVPECR